MVDDVQAIKNIVLSYVEFLDLGDLDALAKVFRRATVRLSGSDSAIRGDEAFRDFIEQTVQFHNGTPSTKHIVSNLIVDVDDDGGNATARSYWTAFQARPDLPLQPILAGRFHDRLERDGDDWRIAERVIYTDLVGDLRCHVKGLEAS